MSRMLCRRLVNNPFVLPRDGRRASRFVCRTMASGQEKGNFVLQYKYIPEILEKRDPHRQGHLDAIKKGIAEDKIVVAGAIADPVDGGLLVFGNVTKDEVEEYAKSDPYSQNGLIESYTIRKFLRVQ